METIKFKIDIKQDNSVKRKIYRRTLKMGVPSFLLPICLIALTGGYSDFDGPIMIFAVIVGTLFVAGLSIWLGIGMAVKNMLTVQLELSNDGIQRIMQNSPFVTIPWNNLRTDYSKSGELILYDKTVNRLTRKWNGKGQIIVPDELENYDQFKEIISKMKR